MRNEASGQRGNRRPRPEFWDQWTVRVATVVVVIVTVLGIAIVDDPKPRSWMAKTSEFVHHVAIAVHGHG